MFFASDLAEMADSMGRDVVAGGFLVIQSDFLRRRTFQPNPRMWEEIYFRVIDGLVFPTTVWDVETALIVLRRQGS
jgi:hypothetical protein